MCFWTLLIKTKDFHGPYMTTFDNLNHILIFNINMSSSEVLEKWPQLAVNGPKLCELAPIFPQMPKISNNCQIFLQHDPNWQCLALMGHVGSFRVILGQFGVILDHFKPFWPFLHSCTEAYINEQI